MSKSWKNYWQRFTKKDKNMYRATMKKIQEIVDCENLNHYKNLKKPMQHLKRVHIDSHFVLTFRHNQSENVVVFYDLEHHERIYR